jgi:hypothetical protein
MPQSVDGAVIPDPNPENYWPFTVGESRELGGGYSLTLIRLKRASAEFRCSGRGEGVKGWLEMNEPAVLIRNAGIPYVTATLRDTDRKRAYLQITAPLSVKRVPIAP